MELPLIKVMKYYIEYTPSTYMQHIFFSIEILKFFLIYFILKEYLDYSAKVKIKLQSLFMRMF